jgi:hypothetical protein
MAHEAGDGRGHDFIVIDDVEVVDDEPHRQVVTLVQVHQQLTDDGIDTACGTLQQRPRSVPNPRGNRLEGGDQG